MSKKKILIKFIEIIIVLLGISFITFLLLYLAPGDPAVAYLSRSGNTPTAEQIAAVREAMGLDRPFLIRYFDWLFRALKGDFGIIFGSQKTVLSVTGKRLIATLNLAVLSMFFTIIISLVFGVFSAIHRNRIWDYLIRIITFSGISMPSFLIGIIFMYYFGLKLKMFPIINEPITPRGTVLIVATLTFAMSVKYIRVVRNLVLEEINKGYITGARARGVSEFSIFAKDVIPNIMLPLITLFGMSFGSLLGGTALIEIIFSYPGIGRYAVTTAVANREYQVIQAYVLLLSLIYMSINFLVDLSYSYLDPRIRRAK